MSIVEGGYIWHMYGLNILVSTPLQNTLYHLHQFVGETQQFFALLGEHVVCLDTPSKNGLFRASSCLQWISQMSHHF